MKATPLPYIERLDADPLFKPKPDSIHSKFAAVIGTDMVGNASLNEQASQNLHYIIRLQTIIHMQRKTLPRVFVYYRQKVDLCAIHEPRKHQVVGPDMVLPARTQPDAGTVVKIKPAALFMPFWHTQAFLPPDAFHALVIDTPAFGP